MPNPTERSRFWIVFFSISAFLTPFLVIFGLEGSKRLDAIQGEKDLYTKSINDTIAEREKYQAAVEAQKQLWQQKMAEAKSQYDATKAKQADAIANNQTTVTVNEPQTTTYTPPPIVQHVPVTTPTPTPQPVRKTKTS